MLYECVFREEDGSVIRPLPKVKRQISDPNSLPHVVQLLLTFDPRLVESVAALLTLAMSDNPAASCLYLTGAFFFVLMYSGSNVLPIAKFLASTHTLQACSRAQVCTKSTIFAFKFNTINNCSIHKCITFYLL